MPLPVRWYFREALRAYVSRSEAKRSEAWSCDDVAHKEAFRPGGGPAVTGLRAGGEGARNQFVRAMGEVGNLRRKAQPSMWESFALPSPDPCWLDLALV
jgi:hypothetical protein